MDRRRKTLFAELRRGETVYRVLLNKTLDAEQLQLEGPCVDFGGDQASYLDHISFADGVIISNIKRQSAVDFICDLNRALPLGSSTLSAALLFNCLYILEDPLTTLAEVRRILKDDGRVVIASPFISQEMVEPEDYLRLTSHGLRRLLADSGFTDIRIVPFGDRFSCAQYLLQPLLRFRPLKILTILVSVLLDGLIPAKLRTAYPAPLGYLCIARKRTQ